MGHTTDLQNELKRLSEGCLDSRRTILEKTCERLRLMASRMLKRFPGVGRWSETDDILQNALLRLHRSLHVVRPESPRKFYGFAAVQIRRELIDLARSYAGPQGLGTKHDSDGGEAAEQQPDERDEPNSLAAWSAFHEVVEELPEAEQEVFGLLYYDGLSQSDAAQVLGISLATLKRRWQSARILLKEMHGGEFFD